MPITGYPDVGSANLTNAEAADRFRVSVTLSRNTGAAGNATIYTVVGKSPEGAVVTDSLEFSATELGVASAVVTKYTNALFSYVSYITPSVAQPADWTVKAGVYTDAGGERIYQVHKLWYDGDHLEYLPMHTLESYYPDWTSDDAATPKYWSTTDGRNIVIYPAESADMSVTAKIIRLEAYVTPDVINWVDGTIPWALHEDFAELIEHHACATLTTRTPDDTSALWRNSEFGKQYTAMLKELIAATDTAHGQIQHIGTPVRRTSFWDNINLPMTGPS